MSRVQQLFANSMQHYIKAVQMVEKLYQQHMTGEYDLKKAVPAGELDLTEARHDFDILVQAILATMAAECDRMGVEERRFVQVLGRKGDLMEYLSGLEDGTGEVTWEQFFVTMTKDQRLAFVKSLGQRLSGLIDRLLDPMLETESHHKGWNFLWVLEQEISAMGGDLCSLTAPPTKEDAMVCVRSIQLLLADPWEKKRAAY